MALLYIDEDLGNFVAPLTELGHDVTFAGDVAPARTDAWHLQRAAHESRALVTYNERDFRFLHRIWTSLRIFGVLPNDHKGVITATEQLAPQQWLPALRQLLASEELRGRMMIWHPSKGEWREDKWRPDNLI